ncbi:MAG: cytochrome c1 [Silicimonas sp.]|nr:cytochrome c1 [Silicimonas sp.]
MIRKIALSAALALGVAGQVNAAGGEAHVHDFAFSFEGPFGTYDTMQLQRGLQVYTEICAACHGLQYVPIRTLADEGGPHLPEDQVRAYAEFYEVFDPELDDFRPAKPTDHFPGSQLENAPDLSLMAKKRAGFHGPYGLGINQFLKGMGGPEYIATLLTSYEEPPECAADAEIEGSYNKAFTAGGIPESCMDEHGHSKIEGSWIAMGQPLYGDDVEFEDGSSTELEAIAQDVSAFLMWTAEPKLNARKEAGFIAVLFLIVLSVLLYLTNKRIWAPIKRKDVHPAE